MIGVRYVETIDTSTGGLTIRDRRRVGMRAQPAGGPRHGSHDAADRAAAPNSVGCYLQADDIAFPNGANRLSATERRTITCCRASTSGST